MASKKQRKLTCCDHTDVKQGTWSPEEDVILFEFVTRNGFGNWRRLPKLAAGLRRCGKSCRLRWLNYLSPDIKRGKFSDEEEEIIINLQAKLGNKWSEIAAKLPGRTDNEIKNVWNYRLNRKVAEKNQKIQSITFQTIGSPGGGFVVEQPSDPVPAVHLSSEISRAVTAASPSVIDLEMEENSEPAVSSPVENSSESGDDGRSEDLGNISFALDEGFWMECLWRAEEE